MRLPELRDISRQAGSTFGAYIAHVATPTIRLGVTGLSQAGKTVFITALVRNLTEGGRLPFFSAMAERRIKAAFLEPQPDDDVPRFAYERHLEALASSPPDWPRSTTRISQLRVTLDVDPQSTWASLVGIRKLHLDLIDYPGEWLLDLALMEQTYADWCRNILTRARRYDHAAVAAPLLDHIAGLDPQAPYDEPAVQRLAELFRTYLVAARQLPPGLATLGPGRFLMPGDLENSPLLTFGPLDLESAGASETGQRGALGTEMARRFESYKLKVVQPFFSKHFARIDRQIVLVDALSALNGGRDTLTDLREAIEAALRAYRPGSNSWLTRLIGRRRIDRILFAATKADHLPQTSHDRLSDILALLTSQAMAHATDEGADIDVLALAALRATRETHATVDGEDLACIRGVPMPGERIGDECFDGEREAAIFPGDLPEDAAAALAAAEDNAFSGVHFVRFRPPSLTGSSSELDHRPWPHIRLDRALEFLLGDRLP
ncbi:MAG: YcjX family protein [Pseudomonadota bacterium]